MFLHRPKTRAAIAGAALLSLIGWPGPAPADTFDETIYLPTSSVVTIPTSSSYLATSYVVPTSYSYTSTIIPTTYRSYIPTSTVISTDSVLVPTSTSYYYRPSIFRSRRYVERTSYALAPTTYSIAPTSYLLPTSTIPPTTYLSSSILTPTSYVIDAGVVTTSYPCETSPSVAPTRATSKLPASNRSGDAPTITSVPTNAGGSTERPPTATMNSNTADETRSSDVVPPVTTPAPAPPSTTPPDVPKVAPKPADAGAPLDQPPVLDPNKIPAAPKPEDGVQIPGPGKLGGQGGPNEMMYRQSRRPSAYETRNILRGRVISPETKLPVEGVTIIVSNITRQFIDRQAMSDADGEFKVSLPDGDWSVKVKTRSGAIYTVGRDITASGGRVAELSGRNVTDMVINY